MAESDAALSRTDLLALADAAHTIKGMAGHFCAEKIINFAVTLEYAARSSTLSDYMITLSSIVIPAWIAGIQAPWMDLSLPSLALDTRFPAGMTSFFII